MPVRLGFMQLTNGIKSYVDLLNYSHPMLFKPLFEDVNALCACINLCLYAYLSH